MSTGGLRGIGAQAAQVRRLCEGRSGGRVGQHRTTAMPSPNDTSTHLLAVRKAGSCAPQGTFRAGGSPVFPRRVTAKRRRGEAVKTVPGVAQQAAQLRRGNAATERVRIERERREAQQEEACGAKWKRTRMRKNTGGDGSECSPVWTRLSHRGPMRCRWKSKPAPIPTRAFARPTRLREIKPNQGESSPIKPAKPASAVPQTGRSPFARSRVLQAPCGRRMFPSTGSGSPVPTMPPPPCGGRNRK